MKYRRQRDVEGMTGDHISPMAPAIVVQLLVVDN